MNGKDYITNAQATVKSLFAEDGQQIALAKCTKMPISRPYHPELNTTPELHVIDQPTVDWNFLLGSGN
jgi:hypothetical protein